jgi:hypothetical protein
MVGEMMTRFAAVRVLAIAAAILQLSVGISVAGDLSLDPRVKKGFEIAASQNISLDQNVPSQGLGSYLVTISSCNDCHTQPNYAPEGSPYLRQPKQVNLSNYLAGGNLFATPAGNFCSRNLTPQQSTSLPAGLTRDQFIHVIKTGCDPQDENFYDSETCGLLNVMPWPNFQNYRIYEISAIYDYLSALPHTEIGVAAPCTPDPQGVAP